MICPTSPARPSRDFKFVIRRIHFVPVSVSFSLSVLLLNITSPFPLTFPLPFQAVEFILAAAFLALCATIASVIRCLITAHSEQGLRVGEVTRSLRRCANTHTHSADCDVRQATAFREDGHRLWRVLTFNLRCCKLRSALSCQALLRCCCGLLCVVFACVITSYTSRAA